MGYAQNGETRLYYETFGDPGAPAVLLLNGAGRQCVDFAEGFCLQIAEGGFRVIRYDSRDTGKSTAFPERPARLLEVYAAVQDGRQPPVAYGLEDMAKDALAVLEAAGESRAHLLGRSIGGMAAQLIAVTAPEHVLSLTLIMANSRSVAGAFSEERLRALEAEVVASESPPRRGSPGAEGCTPGPSLGTSPWALRRRTSERPWDR
jgi:pimeloyl-ACP methyl ester carboxylesterase